MESTFNDNGHAIRADADVRKIGASDAALELAHVADPEVARLRAKIKGGLAAAKKTFSHGTNRVQRHAKDVDGYVRDQPWQAVGIAAAIGLVVGFLAARR
jgi:ElaB/YqjD/DUF883 family membrane-anchored ribosome-binding protein